MCFFINSLSKKIQQQAHKPLQFLDSDERKRHDDLSHNCNAKLKYLGILLVPLWFLAYINSWKKS